MIAHVAGAPVEELLLLVLASGSGTGLLAYARSWTMWPANRAESDGRALDDRRARPRR
jgi:hypothetical protein